jgi:multidrug resistance protein, MATE family
LALSGPYDGILCCTLLISFSRAAFEIVALAAGRLGSLPLAAQSVIMTLDQSEPSFIPAPSAHTNLSMTVLNTIPFGIGEDRALQYLLG